ncbi:hypothetical protein FraQA3DRAFT_4285 [Frankia sp. QA3]|nr:hypothetical protein FraQA3DRAFT_4285 [Frankia sp. QA3]
MANCRSGELPGAEPAPAIPAIPAMPAMPAGPAMPAAPVAPAIPAAPANAAARIRLRTPCGGMTASVPPGRPGAAPVDRRAR